MVSSKQELYYDKVWAVQEKAHKIKLAQNKADFWKAAESKARQENPHSHGLIRTFKAKKKMALDELKYLTRLAIIQAKYNRG